MCLCHIWRTGKFLWDRWIDSGGLDWSRLDCDGDIKTLCSLFGWCEACNIGFVDVEPTILSRLF